MFTKIIFGLLLSVTFVASQTSVNLVLSARNLPNMDIFDGAPDPYVKVLKAEGTSEQYAIIGQTSTFDNQNNPDWPEVFNFNYIVGANQRIRFEVWDYDFDADDAMGKVDISLATIVAISGSLDVDIVDCPKPNCGQLRILRQINGEITVNLDSRFINPKTVIVAT